MKMFSFQLCTVCTLRGDM